MCFPLFMTGFTGWQPSYINYDMCSTNPMNSLNIMWNAALERSKAQSMVYMYPAFSMNNFTSYFNGFNNNYLTNPLYSMSQVMWNNAGQGGNLWNNVNSNWMNPWNNIWNPSGVSSDAVKAESAEEISSKRKYNKILSLIKQLKDYDKVPQTIKDELESALEVDRKNTKGSWTEKYNSLKAAYDKVSDSTVKEYIKESMTLGTKDKPNKDNREVFRLRLEDAGFEYEAGGIDAYIGKLASTIKELNDSSANASSDIILGALDGADASAISILDVLSSWNTKYRNSETDSKKRLITYAAEKYNSLEDENAKSTFKSTVLTPVIDALVNKANELAVKLEGPDKEKVTNAIDVLDNACDKIGDKVPTEVSTAFDNLYLITRWAAIKEIAKDTTEYYGEIDGELFNEKIFETETIKDLREEGYKDEVITSNKVEYINYAAISEYDSETVQKAVNKLVTDNILETLNAKYTDDGKEYTVYREKEVTGSRDHHRLFIIKEDKLMVLNNAQLKEGKITEINSDVAITATETRPSAVKDDSEAEKEKKQKEESLKKSKNAAKEKGIRTTNRLCRWTTKKHSEEINNYLAEIDKDNVLEFFNGAFEDTYIDGKNGKYKIEGIIEKLVDDNAGNNIEEKNIINLVNSFLEKAREMGLEEDPEYSECYNILNNIMTDEDYSENRLNKKLSRLNITELNQSMGKEVIGRPYSNYSSCEVIDDIIKVLYKAMTEKKN